MFKLIINSITIIHLVFFTFNSYSQPDLKLKTRELNELIKTIKENKIALNEGWLRLIHYKKNLFFGYTSQADGNNFFLSDKGKYSPEAELLSTVTEFYKTFKSTNEKENAVCKFPARFLWLKSQKQLKTYKLINSHCPTFEYFKYLLSVKSVTMMFSSYYLNNPSSAFGHTFLRLNKTELPKVGKHFELLDVGINYSASVDTKNAIIYAIKGIFGVFEGHFSSVPYYFKVREYNDFESRSLWGFDLNLSDSQIKLLVAHLWELNSTFFYYYYFTENCSYHMLTVLEAIEPMFNFTKNLPIIVIPSDTLKAVNNTKNLVVKTHYRPSARSVFFDRVNHLSNNNLDIVEKIVNTKSIIDFDKKIEDVDKTDILDTAIDYLDYKYSKELFKKKTKIAAFKQDLLVLRSKLKIPSKKFTRDFEINKQSPLFGHDSTRLSIEGGQVNNSNYFSTISYRMMLHDLLDTQYGYPIFAQLEFFNLKVRYKIDKSNSIDIKNLSVDDFALVRTATYSPINRFDKPVSWRMRVGLKGDGYSEISFKGIAELHGGLSFEFYNNPHILFYMLGGVNVLISPYYKTIPLRFPIGPTLGLRLMFSNNLIALFEGSYKYIYDMNPKDEKEIKTEIRWNLFKGCAVNLRGKTDLSNYEMGIGLFVYF